MERGVRPGLHGGQRADHLQRHGRVGLPHGDGEEAVLGPELGLRLWAPERDAPDERGGASSQQVVRVHRDVRPGERPEPEVGDDGRTGSVVVRERVGPCERERALLQPLSSAVRHPPPLRVLVAE